MKRKVIPHFVVNENWYAGFVLHNYSDVENTVTLSFISEAGNLVKTMNPVIAPFRKAIITPTEMALSGSFSLYIDGPDDLMITPQQMDLRSGVFLPLTVEEPSNPVTLKNE